MNICVKCQIADSTVGESTSGLCLICSNNITLVEDTIVNIPTTRTELRRRAFNISENAIKERSELAKKEWDVLLEFISTQEAEVEKLKSKIVELEKEMLKKQREAYILGYENGGSIHCNRYGNGVLMREAKRIFPDPK